jgi:putative inorganic carbon (HCO3(-)) transporter
MQFTQNFRAKLFQPVLFLPLFLLVLAGSVVIGGIASWQPLASIFLVLGLCFVPAMFIWPDISTLIVVFILYTNAAVVAVRFHHLPFFLGAIFPSLLLFPIIYHLVIKRRNVKINLEFVLIMIFLAIQFFSAIFSENIKVVISELVTFITEGLIIYLLVINAVRTKAELRRVVWVLLIAGAFMGGLSLFQQATGTFENNYGGFAQVGETPFGTGVQTLQGEAEQPRLAGPIGEKNRYAQIMLMLVPLGFFRYWSEESKGLRLIAAILTGLILAGTALSFSRGAAVGFVLMLITIVLMRYIKFHQLVMVVFGTIIVLIIFPQYGKRLASLGELSNFISTGDIYQVSSADGAIRGRLTEMLAAAHVFADHPLIGVGPGMYKYYSQQYGREIGLKAVTGTFRAHDLYLEIAAETGIFGLICFLMILFLTLRNLAKVRGYWLKRSPDLANMATGFWLALLSYMTTGIFLHLSYIRYFWFMLALCGATSQILGEDIWAEPSSNEHSLRISPSNKDAILLDKDWRRSHEPE